MSMHELSEVESIFSNVSSVHSSHSSMDEVRISVVSEINDLFLHHDQLQPLCDLAIAKVGPEKFERNFKRFLQRYGRNLHSQASEQLEIRAAKFIRGQRNKLQRKSGDLSIRGLRP
jgi:hypothetical protein